MAAPLAPAIRMPDKGAMRLAAILLAGGHGTRMGRPKDSLPWQGRPLLAHLVDALADACAPIAVVARDDAQVLPPLPAGVVRLIDAASGRGPLAGIAAGLRWQLSAPPARRADAVLAAGCDQPFVTGAIVQWLAQRLGGHDAVMPRAGDALQPLLAIYRPAAAPVAERLLADGAGPRDLATVLRTRIVDAEELRAVDADLRCLRDLDTPGDYAAARGGWR